MAKKKNKAYSGADLRKQQKIRLSQSRNLFEEKLREICALIGDTSLYDLIPVWERAVMYMWRGMPPKVVMAEESTETKYMPDLVESILKHYLDTETMELIHDSGIEISMSDYFSVAMSMRNMLRCKECDFPGKERFDYFIENSEDCFTEYNDRLLAQAKVSCSSFDDISANNLFACSLDVGTDDDGNPIATMIYNPQTRNTVCRMKSKIIINVLHPEEKQVEVDGITLPAKQVGVVDYDDDDNPKIVALYVTPKQLKIKHNKQDLSIQIYITPHAIDRLLERTGCTIISYAATFMYMSIFSGNFIPLSPKTFLMEYRLMDYKIGYFMAELTDGILLLRTFRLLTHPDTPEGAMITKLAKQDAAYNELLNFNTLRPLLESTTLDNYGDSTATRLINAGCKPIVDFCRRIRRDGNLGFVTHNRKPKGVQLPDFSLKTVLKNQSGLNNNEEFLM
jgi:hypothetical protein